MSEQKPGVDTATEVSADEKVLNRRKYLTSAAAGVASAGAAALAMPSIAHAQNRRVVQR